MYLQLIGAGQRCGQILIMMDGKTCSSAMEFPKRLNDMDYMNYVSNDELQEKIRTNRVE